MKIRFAAVLAASVATGFLAGCASSGTHDEVKAQYEKFQQSKPPVAFAVCGDRAIDDAGVLSAQVYGQIWTYLDEYVKATENNRFYIGFLNDVNAVMTEEKLAAGPAMQKVLAEIKEADKALADKDKVLPRVVDGYNAVQKLNPANKLKELAPVAIQAAKVALLAKDLSNSISKTYGSIDFRDVNGLRKKAAVTASAANVVEQTGYNIVAIEFLQDQYSRNQDMVEYMK